MIILAIETSCDETAVAIVEFKKDRAKVLANVVSSQAKAHSKYGGVVPALAARMHLKNMVPVLRRAFEEARKHTPSASQPTPLKRGICCTASQPIFLKRGIHFDKNKIDYVAVTNGPGLIPALTIGVSAAKALAYSLNKPLIGVNHLEGHIYANWLTEIEKSIKSKVRKVCKIGSDFKLWKPKFPILCLVVSGGHTQLVLIKKDLNYKIIGETMDDAVGEAFDKVAKLLELGYPGGPLIEKIAKKGDKNKFKFTRPMMNSKNYNFSFSGLKTAVLYEVGFKHTPSASQSTPLKRGIYCTASQPTFKREIYSENNNVQYNSDIAASFQEAVIDVLISKTIRAAKEYKVKNVILGGGVSSNKELQKQFKEAIKKEIPDSRFQIPDSNLSTDNALMIAIASYYNIINNKNIKSWKNVKADANLRL